MKRIVVCIFWLSFIGPNIINAQQEMTGEDIIKAMTATMNPEAAKGKIKMTIMTTSGQERTFVYETYSKNHGEKSLLKYLKPTRVKGQAILMLNNADDIWVYFPRTKRVRKLATHAKRQKLEGSDFSYEDMGASNTFITEYDVVKHRDEKKQNRLCYRLELTRRPKSSAGYPRLMVWVDKDDLVPLVIDYYHDKDPQLLEKELILSNIQLIDSIYTPMKLVMFNKLDDTKTSMEFIDVSYKVDLPDELFTEMGMQR